MKIRMINIYVFIFIVTLMSVIEILIRNIESGCLIIIIRNVIATSIIASILLTIFTYIVYKKKYPVWIGYIVMIFISTTIIQIIGIVNIYVNTQTIKVTPVLMIMTLVGDSITLISFIHVHIKQKKYNQLLKDFKNQKP